MARVPADDFLDRVAERGGLTPGIARPSRRLRGARPCTACRRSEASRSPNGWHRSPTGNAQSALQAGLPPDQVTAWRDRILALVEDLRPWLQQRSVDGFVRRCHGDLHLGNLCLWEGAAGRLRRAGVRRGHGDDRHRLRPGVPADGPRSAGRSSGGEPGDEPVCGQDRGCGAGGRAAAVSVAAGDDPRAYPGGDREAGGRASPAGRGAGLRGAASGRRAGDRRPARHRQIHARPRFGTGPRRCPRRADPAQRRTAQTSLGQGARGPPAARGLCTGGQ